MERWTNIISGSIYFALNKMEEEGLVRAEAEERTGARVRKIYAITGRRRLRPRMLNGLCFLAMKLKAKYGAEWLPYEHGYWRERGWFGKSYRQAAKP